MAAISAAATAQSAEVTRVGDDVTWRVDAASASGQRLEIRGRRDTYRLLLPLLGEFQAANAANAVGAAESLIDAGYPVDSQAIVAGLESVEWPGRPGGFCGSPPSRWWTERTTTTRWQPSSKPCPSMSPTAG